MEMVKRKKKKACNNFQPEPFQINLQSNRTSDYPYLYIFRTTNETENLKRGTNFEHYFLNSAN